MNLYNIDRTQHATEPEPLLLGDGFSSPHSLSESAFPRDHEAPPTSLEQALATKSDF